MSKPLDASQIRPAWAELTVLHEAFINLAYAVALTHYHPWQGYVDAEVNFKEGCVHCLYKPFYAKVASVPVTLAEMEAYLTAQAAVPEPVEVIV